MNIDQIAQLEAVGNAGFRDITIGDLTLSLRPVTLVECLRLLTRQPSLKFALFGGDADEATLLDVLLTTGPDAVASLVAASMGSLGDARAEAAIARLPDDILLPLVGEVVQITMPEGLEPFFERLSRLAGVAGMVPAEPAAPVAERRVRRAGLSQQTRS